MKFLCLIHIYSSPDSDDTFSGECEDGIIGANGDFPVRDDQFLIADRLENKFYGEYINDDISYIVNKMIDVSFFM